jgi:hypothetical protein
MRLRSKECISCQGRGQVIRIPSTWLTDQRIQHTRSLFHGMSVVQALAALFGAINRSIPYPVATLTALWASRDDVGRARAATAGIELAVAESFSASGHQIVRVFESGLVIVINRETSHADFYSTNRIDFRRFHRDVSKEHSALFELTSLGGADGQEL